MADRKPSIVLFAEDRAHEEFVTSIVTRLAQAEGLPKPRFDIGSARGGHGKAVSELRLFQRMKARHNHDLLIVVIDADRESWNTVHGELDRLVDRSIASHVAIGCPEPHIERWYLADPPSLMGTLGVNITLEGRRAERNFYKNILKRSLQDAGHTVSLGGIEFAREIVECMDLFNAGKNEPSLRHFLEEIRSAFRTIAPDCKAPS